MIPVEYFWLMLILLFGVIGMVRGLWKELGTTTILLLTLAALNLLQKSILDKLLPNLPAGMLDRAPTGTVQAVYYGAILLFAAFISYQGIVLEFPIKKQKGVLKWALGYLGGLLNGYFIVGTVWNVANEAQYFGLKVPLGATGNMIDISSYTTKLHGTLTRYLPVTLMNANDFVPFIMLTFGLILLLAIILK
jgi:uncharacterized membrane protein required for colicin V production